MAYGVISVKILLAFASNFYMNIFFCCTYGSASQSTLRDYAVNLIESNCVVQLYNNF